MSFNILIQQNKSDDNKLTKDVVTLGTMTGNLKAGTSILSPIILFTGSLPTNANYMTIDTFGRKYFITDIRSVGNNLYEVSAKVDVLSTYANSIKNCRGIIARQENKWNLYIDDGSFKVYQYPENTIKLFPNGFTNYEFVLAVAGG